MTQAGQVKDLLEAQSESQFELKIIKTQGDQITDKPLWQLDGKDFFTRELDQALLAGEVDLVIHSYKDLGSERPEGIELKAITERTFGNDVLLIRKEILHRHRDLDQWIIGTSSPRRMSNLKRSLGHHLPHNSSGALPINIEMLRGNVNTRIEKCLRGDFHGIVLALAGLERLGQTKSSRETLEKLLEEMTFMVLPSGAYPWAAAQGALAIEIGPKGRQDAHLCELIKSVHHPKTAREVSIEKEHFRRYGGGCHLALGVAVRELSEEHTLIFERGEHNDTFIDEHFLQGPPLPEVSKSGPFFIGLPPARMKDERFIGDELMPKAKVHPLPPFNRKGPHQWFVTHPHTIDLLDRYFLPGDLIWAAGDKTHRALCARGYFVNGNADSLGEDLLAPYTQSKALGLMHQAHGNWTTLTHKDGSSELGDVLEGYQRQLQEVGSEFKEKIEQAVSYYWTSYSQFQTYEKHFTLNPKGLHFCGMGKTWKKFKQVGLEVTPLSSITFLLQQLEQ